jgi:hypothetical protein
LLEINGERKHIVRGELDVSRDKNILARYQLNIISDLRLLFDLQ